MAAPQNFRSALNGFNREDVVHYLEFINTRHNTELNKLKLENEALQAEVNTLRDAAAAPADTGELDALRGKVAELETQNAALAAEAEALRGQLAELSAQRDQALAAQAKATDHAAQELEAYRRAERVERVARERANQVYQHANGILADATVKVDEAAAQIDTMAAQVSGHLASLQSLVSDSKAVLQDAVSSLYALRPEEE